MFPLRLIRALAIVSFAFTVLPLRAESPTAQVDKARAEPKVLDRLNALSAIGANLALEDIPDALKLAGTLPVLRERAVLEESVLKRWTKLAPADAFAFIASLPDSRQKMEVLRAAADAFARQNPLAAAVDWAEKLEPAPAREAALHAIRFVWVHADPAAAAPYVSALPSSEIKNALLMNIGGAWAERDPASAIAWAKTLPVGSEQTAALVNVAESWADNSPTDAAAFALSLPPEPRMGAVAGVTARWATQNPAAAAAWIPTIDPSLQPRALAALLDVWTGVGPEAAATWIEQLPAGRLRDVAVASFVAAAGEWNFLLAARLVPLASAGAQRAQAVRDLIMRWSEYDPAAAQKWSADLASADAVPATEH